MGCAAVAWSGGGDGGGDGDDGGGYVGDLEAWMREERGTVVCEGDLMAREMGIVGV